MIPRGEVGIVVAQIGLSLTGNHALYGLVVAMAVITTLAAPPLIRLTFKGEPVTAQDSEEASELQHELR